MGQMDMSLSETGGCDWVEQMKVALSVICGCVFEWDKRVCVFEWGKWVCLCKTDGGIWVWQTDVAFDRWACLIWTKEHAVKWNRRVCLIGTDGQVFKWNMWVCLKPEAMGMSLRGIYERVWVLEMGVVLAWSDGHVLEGNMWACLRVRDGHVFGWRRLLCLWREYVGWACPWLETIAVPLKGICGPVWVLEMGVWVFLWWSGSMLRLASSCMRKRVNSVFLRVCYPSLSSIISASVSQ